MSNYNHEEYTEKAQKLLNEKKCYEVVLSTKDRLKCDADELWRVMEAIKTGSPVKLRQGIFNPSYYVAIVLDEKRYAEFSDKVYGVLRSNQQALEYHNGQGLQRLPEFKSLADIFAGTSLKLPAPTSNAKRLEQPE